MADSSKIPRFVLGREVSSGQVFKSSFARSFVTSFPDTKSLDYEFLDHKEAAAQAAQGDRRNNNFASLVNFPNPGEAAPDDVDNRKTDETIPPTFTDITEVERLRKQCLMLAEENRRLQSAMTSTQVADGVQVIDNIYLQTEVETLQWQLKQSESSRQMYRSVMEQVQRFLNRTHKSLDILHEKTNPRGKRLTSPHVPRSRSVHASVPDKSPTRCTPTTSSSSSSASSRFTRAKSATQISPCTMGFREFTWSVLRRNEPVHSTPTRVGKPTPNLNKTEGAVYPRPAQPEIDPDDVPPIKLSQEAFRLMRTVQSLLTMREPDLARITSMEGVASPSSSPDDNQVDDSLNLQTGNFVNSTAMQDADGYNGYNGCSSSDRGNESSSTSGSRSPYMKSSVDAIEEDRNLQSLLPGVRGSIGSTSVNSGSSKSTEEEDVDGMRNGFNGSLTEYKGISLDGTPTSTPKNQINKMNKKDAGKSSKSNPSASVSSVEDESGFSSMSSFQEVGLPTVMSRMSIKGRHGEVGLPAVPHEKTRHRRWSSTPNEMRTLFKQHRASFTGAQANTESISVWV